MLGFKKDYTQQEQYVEDALWRLYCTMSHVFEYMTHTYTVHKDYEKAIAFFDAHEKLLSVFDAFFGEDEAYARFKKSVSR